MCLTEDEDILKELFLPVVLYGRQMLFKLDMHVQNFEYICPIYMTWQCGKPIFNTKTLLDVILSGLSTTVK